jgi:hypothetical protein
MLQTILIGNPRLQYLNRQRSGNTPHAEANPEARITSTVCDYYLKLDGSLNKFPEEVDKGLYLRKQSFKDYLTDLLNTWVILARLAFYASLSIIDYSFNPHFKLTEEEIYTFEAWNHVPRYVEKSMKMNDVRSKLISLGGLLAAENAKCFSIRFEEDCLFFTMHHPLWVKTKQKIVLNWSFLALKDGNFTERGRIFRKVKWVVQMVGNDVDWASGADGKELLAQNLFLTSMHKPIIRKKLSNWSLWVWERPG